MNNAETQRLLKRRRKEALLAMLRTCDVCDEETKQGHKDCQIYRFFTKYFDLNRNGKICPYAELKEQEG